MNGTVGTDQKIDLAPNKEINETTNTKIDGIEGRLDLIETDVTQINERLHSIDEMLSVIMKWENSSTHSGNISQNEIDVTTARPRITNDISTTSYPYSNECQEREGCLRIKQDCFLKLWPKQNGRGYKRLDPETGNWVKDESAFYQVG